MIHLACFTWLLGATPAMAAVEPSKAETAQMAEQAQSQGAASVKYKAGKEIDFESLLIQGQLKRPEFSVVTGNADQNGDGVLRMRENFIDRMSADLGEEIGK
jgi:hypothetical protein